MKNEPSKIESSRIEPSRNQSSTDLPPLARIAGASALAASLFALAAVVSFGVSGRGALVAWVCVLAGLVCLALYLVGRKQAQRYLESVPLDAAGKSRTLLGVNAVSSTLLVGVLLVGGNYIAARRHKTFDLTQNRINSLADQTYNALGALPRPVTLNYYYKARQIDPAVKSLLDSYQRASDKIRVNYVNALNAPIGLPAAFTGRPMLVAQIEAATPKNEAASAREAKPALDASTIQEVSSINEQGITSSLLKLANPKSAKIYFLTGHGEADPRKMSDSNNALVGQNYALETLSLLQKNAKIPADTSALVIAAPQVDLSEPEVKILKGYLNGKGRLVLLLSPLQGNTTLPRWNSLLKSAGVQVGRGYLSDTQQAYLKAEYPVGLLGDKGSHPILAGTSGDVVFPAAVPLTPIVPAPPAVTLTPLFEASTSAQVLGAQGGSRDSFLLAAAVEKGEARIFVSASTFLLDNQFLGLLGDRSFWLAGINWTVGNETLVSIPPKPPTTNTIAMPVPTARFVMFLSLLVMPVLALLLGAVVWWVRR